MRIITVFAFLILTLSSPARAEDYLTGDMRLACEAILCLSSGVRPGECSPSLSRYFGINKKKWSDTLKARMNFLNLCPSASEPDMPGLVSAIVNGAGQCNAEILNRVLARQETVLVCDDNNQFWNREEDRCREMTIIVIDDTLPSYCRAYTSHHLAWKVGVRYVGDKLKDGKWVDEQ